MYIYVKIFLKLAGWASSTEAEVHAAGLPVHSVLSERLSVCTSYPFTPRNHVQRKLKALQTAFTRLLSTQVGRLKPILDAALIIHGTWMGSKLQFLVSVPQLEQWSWIQLHPRCSLVRHEWSHGSPCSGL